MIRRQIDEMAKGDQAAGYMSEYDYKELGNVGRTLKNGSELDEQKAHYLCSILEKSYSQDYFHGHIVRIRVMSTLQEYHGKYSDKVRTELYHGLFPMTKTRDQNDPHAIDRMIFCHAVLIINEPKAITELTTLMSDPRPIVAESAKNAIKTLQKTNR